MEEKQEILNSHSEEGKSPLHCAVEEEIEYMINDGILEELLGNRSSPEVESLYNSDKEEIITAICEKINFHDVIKRVFDEKLRQGRG